MTIIYKKVETINEFIDAVRIRVDVFIIEQKCPPGWEPDELDKFARHFIAVADGEIAATVRLREDPEGVAKMECMAVKKAYRRRGIAFGLTKYTVEQAREEGYKKIWMQAQEYAKSLYEKAWFTVTSEPYDLFNLGITHVDMECILEK